jgi:hypothetical protein
VWQVFSLYLKMTRTKKFASKTKFRGHEYVRVNKDTDVTEKGQTLSDQSCESSCVKHNLTASNKNIRGTSVNTVNKVGENNFCKIESNFARGGNIVVSKNLLFGYIEENTNCVIVVVILLCLKIH